MFAVVYETSYKTKVLYSGTFDQCKKFRLDNHEICDDYSFIQELDAEYA